MQIGDHVLVAMLVLCRIGACLMVVPGLASARVPMRVRLLLAVVLSFLVAPVAETGAVPGLAAGPGMLKVVFFECVTGALLGLCSRVMIELMEFAGSAISNYIGLSAISGSADGDEPVSAIASLVAMIAILLLVLMDFPQHVVVALADSYSALPFASPLDPEAGLRLLAGTIAAASLIALQISAPFLVYGVIANVLFGILGKLVPQVPSYFLSAPFLALGGLALLYLATGEVTAVVRGGLDMLVLRH